MKSSKLIRLQHNLKSLNIKDYLLYGLEGTLLISIFGYFFYRSIFITLICLPLTFFYIAYKAEKMQKSKILELQIQFKDVLISVNSSLRAGYSIENAFLEAEREMIVFYGQKSNMAKELSILRLGLNNGKNLPQILFEMGKRNEATSIQEFASILVIGKQTGGNITEIIDAFIHIAEGKLQVKQEIETIISSKRYEQKIMNCVPFLIIFYIEITNKGFFDVLYNNVLGRIIMSICLIVYIFSLLLSERIIDINL